MACTFLAVSRQIRFVKSRVGAFGALVPQLPLAGCVKSVDVRWQRNLTSDDTPGGNRDERDGLVILYFVVNPFAQDVCGHGKDFCCARGGFGWLEGASVPPTDALDSEEPVASVWRNNHVSDTK